MEKNDMSQTPPISDKQVEVRYARPSVNWGTIAVHPTDLVTLYLPLFTKRHAAVSCSEGGAQTRTTSLAYGLAAVLGLLSNGYEPEEVTTILASLVSTQEEDIEVEDVKEERTYTQEEVREAIEVAMKHLQG
jgi:hypothetical protein